MRIDKRFFSQIETAFSAVGLPLSVYTATGEQLYPPSEQGVREEEIPHLDFAEGIARMGSMCYLRLDNLKGMVVGAPNYVPNCDQILNMAGILLRAMAGNLDHGMDRDEVLRRVLLDGLDGTELAISESQERMAVVLAPEDVEAFLAAAHDENLEATVVAQVTAEPRLRMRWKGNTIVDLSREFLNSNGAAKHQDVRVLPGLPGPMSIVLWPKCLLLDREDYDDAALDAILRHELVHACGQNVAAHRFSWLLLGAIFWFVPTVWLFTREARLREEYTCDRDANAFSNREELRAYARAITALAAPRRREAFGTANMACGESSKYSENACSMACCSVCSASSDRQSESRRQPKRTLRICG